MVRTFRGLCEKQHLIRYGFQGSLDSLGMYQIKVGSWSIHHDRGCSATTLGKGHQETHGDNLQFTGRTLGDGFAVLFDDGHKVGFIFDVFQMIIDFRFVGHVFKELIRNFQNLASHSRNTDGYCFIQFLYEAIAETDAVDNGLHTAVPECFSLHLSVCCILFADCCGLTTFNV
ncbi:hypothetical protein SDC9_79535 [bioreactor metagenome]|uniref:Uncharacterized protein n=1 Tax=bioreactor metagenome TaxID=1076179 RepID=A0A644YY67_9ZZZZ